MAAISNTYGSDGALRTRLPRQGVDIGPTPDFWGDLGNIVRTLKPQAPVQTQVAALRQPAGGYDAPSTMSAAVGRDERTPRQPEYDYEPIFGTLTYPHGSAGFYQNYQPGQTLGTGQSPVAMGYQRVRRS